MSYRSKEQVFSKMFALASALDWPRIVSRVPNATREIPARLPVSNRCVAKWLEGETKPSADNVVYLMSEFAEIADAILEVAKINNGLTEVQKRKLREILGEK